MVIVSVIIGLAIAGVAAYYLLFTDRRDVYERALNMAAEGHFVDARGLIRAKIEGHPDNSIGHYTMARVYAL